MPSERPRRSPLPVVVPLVALLGLAVTGFYAVPAAVEHRRLEREHATRERMARDAQDALEARRRAVKLSEEGETYARRKKRRLLQRQGPAYIRDRDRRVDAGRVR